jgi:hypothetical protein
LTADVCTHWKISDVEAWKGNKEGNVSLRHTWPPSVSIRDDDDPTNEISVQWGRFKLAIVGPFALITALGMVVAVSFGNGLAPLLLSLVRLGLRISWLTF